MDSESDVPKIRLDMVEYPLVSLEDMTLGERIEFEKIAGDGVDKLAQMEERYRDALLVAWMAVSIKRTKPETPISQIVDRLTELKQADLTEAWQDVRAQSPPETTPLPASLPASPATIELGFDAITVDDLASGLLRATGSLSSVRTSDSDRATSAT